MKFNEPFSERDAATVSQYAMMHDLYRSQMALSQADVLWIWLERTSKQVALCHELDSSFQQLWDVYIRMQWRVRVHQNLLQTEHCLWQSASQMTLKGRSGSGKANIGAWRRLSLTAWKASCSVSTQHQSTSFLRRLDNFRAISALYSLYLCK